MSRISEDLFHFQASLGQSGSSLEEYIRESYVDKWVGDTLPCAMAIRTTWVAAITRFLADEGLLNLERVQMSPVTDPLAHDVEHVPTITYKGMPYVATHSMIYSKFLACYNPRIKGIFVDSPNIRLEIESPQRQQRGKYLIDFSQIDIEVRRNRGIDLETYKGQQDKVSKILDEDYEKALNFFERMIIAAASAVADKNDDELKALGVAINVPTAPFPRFRLDEITARFGKQQAEAKAALECDSQFYWITGRLRENYDLIYPYLNADGSKRALKDLPSTCIYNYDICARSLIRSTNRYTPAIEVFSGGLREWLFEPIVERLLDNRIIPQRPIFENGEIVNIADLDGYGPFLMAASLKNAAGQPLFPDTFGGGLGVERSLYA
jgi:aspartyl/asparaginyl-tRNA synthetase